MTEIPTPVLNLLKTKFNIIEHLSFLDFDYNFDILKTKLLAVHKTEFAPQDRIIIEHLDIDFYYNESPVGINLRNFFTVADIVDIPLNIFVFYTNHFGIQKEIDIICKNKHIKDRPTLLESFISDLHNPRFGYQQKDCNISKIEYNALSLINGTRSHRHALYNHICHIDKKHLAINYTPK